MFEVPPFRVHRPTGRPCPLVASIPHSGLRVPPTMAQALRAKYQAHLPHQDWHLDKLYDWLPELGITVLEAVYSRYVVDLNRAAQAPYLGDFWRSAVTKQTAHGQPLYRVLPPREQIQSRIDHIHRPYHQTLEQLLRETVEQFGHAYLLDLHSFAGPILDQVCLGNGNGKTCGEPFMAAVESAFSFQGYQVARNHVFNGGYITRHHGAMPDVEALQIELRYHNYLNHGQLQQERVPDWDIAEFHRAKPRIRAVFDRLVLGKFG